MAEVSEALRIALNRKAEHLEEVVAMFQRALGIQPNFPEAHNNLANAYRAQVCSRQYAEVEVG